MQIKTMFYMALLALAVVACSSDDGWKELPYGYKYQLFPGEGGEAPEEGDAVFIYASMVAGDSVMFDSRGTGQASPFQMMPKDAPRSDISPIQDLLYEMTKGDSARLTYPVDSFDSPQAAVPGYSEVTYIVKVTDVMKKPEFEQWMAEENRRKQDEVKATKAREPEVKAFVDSIYVAYKAGDLDDQITRTESGLGYIIHDEGNPGTAPNPGDPVTAHYYGLIDATGEHFQNSFSRGSPFTFAVVTGQVIQGWHEGFALLNKGARATLFVPAELAYGDQARPPLIEPNSDLIFYVENVDEKQDQ